VTSVQSARPTDDGYEALAADGTPLHIRQLQPTDGDELRALVSRLSTRSIYQRLFAASSEAAFRYLARLLDPAEPAIAVVALRRGHFVALGSLHPYGDGTAEFALLVPLVADIRVRVAPEHDDGLGRRSGTWTSSTAFHDAERPHRDPRTNDPEAAGRGVVSRKTGFGGVHVVRINRKRAAG
jgi:hypothetical protein